MKKSATLFFFLTAFLCTIYSSVQAQRRYLYFSVGPSIGLSHYQGDLDDNGFDLWAVFETAANRNNGNPFALLRPAFGGQLNFHFHPNFYARLNFNYGSLGAADSNNADPARKYRNLHFRSRIMEFGAHIVYELFATDRHYKYRPTWSPYVFTGLNVFTFNPQAKPDKAWVDAYPGYFGEKNYDEWVDLKPLGTEGQYLSQTDGDGLPRPYSLTQFSIPLGIGVRRKLTDKIDLRLEFGVRKTFTDYIDDASGAVENENGELTSYANPEQLRLENGIKSELFSDRSGYKNIGLTGYQARDLRGDKRDDDWYGFTNLSITFILDRGDRCPKFFSR